MIKYFNAGLDEELTEKLRADIEAELSESLRISLTNELTYDIVTSVTIEFEKHLEEVIREIKGGNTSV